MLVAAAVFATAALPAHGQGQGQGQGQGGQGQGQGQGGQGQGGGPPGGGPGSGGGAAAAGGGNDGDFALEAVRSKRALPLADILATARETVPGEVIDARLVTIRGFLVYEVKSMTGDGHVGLSYYYAESGRKVSTD